MEIPWNDNSGQKLNIDLSTSGKIKISSPRNNATTARSMVLKVTTTKGTPAVSKTITVRQAASVYTYEFRLSSNPDRISSAGGTSNIIATLLTYRDGLLISTENVNPTLSGSAPGFTLKGSVVTAPNRGTTYGDDRNITITGTTVAPETGATLKATTTVTQSFNHPRKITIVGNSIDWTPSGNISPAGGTITGTRHSSWDVLFSTGAILHSPANTADYQCIGTRRTTMPATEGFTWNESTYTLTGDNMGTISGSRSVTLTSTVTYVLKNLRTGNNNVSTDSDTITITKTQGSNNITYGTPVISQANTPILLGYTGVNASYPMQAQGTQTRTWTSGSKDSIPATISYAVKTPVTGFTLNNSTVTATTNTSTSQRGGFVVTVTATGQGSKVATKDITFNQEGWPIVIRSFSDKVSTFADKTAGFKK